MRPLFLANGHRFNLDRHRFSNRFAGFQRTNTAMAHETGSSWNQVTHDHIFLEAAEIVDLTKRRRLR